MSTTADVDGLFARMSQLESAEERQSWLLLHPLLAEPTVIDRLAARPSSASSCAALAELQAFAAEVGESPTSYPLGQGPLERLWKRVLDGELREERALEMAAAGPVADVLGERYARTVGFYCAKRALSSENWQRALRLHQLLLAAARSCSNPMARAVRIRAEREWLVTACAVLMHVADGRVYRDAMQGGDWLLRTLDSEEEGQLYVETLHYLGVLNLDPYTAFRNPYSHEAEHRVWLSNTALEFGAEVTEGIPEPAAALALAEGYLSRAAAHAEGRYAAYIAKARHQAADWRELLEKGQGRASVAPLLTGASALVTPDEDPKRWLSLAESTLASGGRVDEEHLLSLLAVSPDEWAARAGSSYAVEVITTTLLLLARDDPWHGIERATQTYRLIEGVPLEAQRANFFRSVVRCFEAVAVGLGMDSFESGVAGRLVQETPKYLQDVSTSVHAATLIAVASASPVSDDESSGLVLVDRAVEIAPEIARMHAPLLTWVRLSLWLGVGANAANADPQRNVEAIAAYESALVLSIEGDFRTQGIDLWDRLENIAWRQDFGGARAILKTLVRLALVSEFALGELALERIRGICEQLSRCFAKHDPERLLIIWQIAKGHRWAASLGGAAGYRPREDDEAQRILRTVAEARRELPEGGDLSPWLAGTDSTLFEAWLMSYVRTERYGGDGWERVANLKMTLDERLAANLVPKSAPPPLSVREIQNAIPADAVMLSLYTGRYSEEARATYALLVTRENISAVVSVRTAEADGYKIKWRGRSTVLSTVGASLADLRSTLAEAPAHGAVVSESGARALEAGLAEMLPSLSDDLVALHNAGKKHLIFAPHDAFHFAPFHLFTIGGAPLADHWLVSYLPNLALLGRTRPKTPAYQRSRATCIGLSFKDSEGGWTPIEEARLEAEQIASILECKALLDGQASKPAVVEAFENSTCVHIASHGALDVDAAAFQMIVLEPADEENALFAYEMLDLNLSGLELVTLSACETALGRIDRSDNLRGLGAALFTAGVNTIVGTLWEAETTASHTFFTSFYRSLDAAGNRGPLTAFRAAQIETRARHPEYRDWGAFYIAGGLHEVGLRV